MTSDITYCNATKCEYADFCERHYSHHLPTNPEGRNMWMQDFSVSIGLTAAGGAKCPPCPYFLERPDPKDGLKKLRELDYGKHLRALGMTVKQYMEWVRGKEDEEDEEGGIMTSTLCHSCKHYDWWNSCDGFKDDDADRSVYVPDIVKTCPFYSPYYRLPNFIRWIANQFRLLTGHGFECRDGNRNEG